MPGRENAIVEDSKIAGYLLNLQHPDGRSKAGFFLRAGFGLGQAEEFRELLLRQAMWHQVSKTEQTKFGTKYIIDGIVETPHHFSFNLRTVWMLGADSEQPKLVTAYPLTP
ncbi:hypothetical protein CLV24_1585 [Pontibacter ummariensis]|uniref:DUF6883 domain-containing protein n=1 Tax=Pontibacter ummariensis TaxID=1610492 RepID=A0A239M006_9BACT|nr:DUF6883 domain-containing protein [Pontibacter ummariensis]PRY00086.1 hypothetical protein CLV24_1585 [Pontibacter ummariensis]SNT35264.1 hypothetical protein SAMN06296052_1585 [Pontibacter ummariensis]